MQTITDYFPFLGRVRFWVWLFAAVTLFGRRFGLELSQEETAMVNMGILIVFGMEPDVRQGINNVRAVRALNKLVKEKFK